MYLIHAKFLFNICSIFIKIYIKYKNKTYILVGAMQRNFFCNFLKKQTTNHTYRWVWFLHLHCGWWCSDLILRSVYVRSCG